MSEVLNNRFLPPVDRLVDNFSRLFFLEKGKPTNKRYTKKQILNLHMGSENSRSSLDDYRSFTEHEKAQFVARACGALYRTNVYPRSNSHLASILAKSEKLRGVASSLSLDELVIQPKNLPKVSINQVAATVANSKDLLRQAIEEFHVNQKLSLEKFFNFLNNLCRFAYKIYNPKFKLFSPKAVLVQPMPVISTPKSQLSTVFDGEDQIEDPDNGEFYPPSYYEPLEVEQLLN
jgi:hypothetical protein